METNASRIFDRQWVLEQIGGDESLLHAIIEVFLVDSPAIRQQLTNALQDLDTHKLHAAAHCAKSAVGNFGAQAAVQAAARLEDAAKTGDTSGLDSLTETLCRALISAEDTLRQEIS